MARLVGLSKHKATKKAFLLLIGIYACPFATTSYICLCFEVNILFNFSTNYKNVQLFSNKCNFFN